MWFECELLFDAEEHCMTRQKQLRGRLGNTLIADLVP